MVQKACEYLEVAPDKETMLRLLDVLRTVTVGKVQLAWALFAFGMIISIFNFQIHVEIERARLTMKLAKVKEADGEIAGTYNCFELKFL